MDYSSNISLLTEEDCNTIQAVYASQLYKTFFGVFAKFEINEFIEDGKVDPSRRIISKITYTLINYKGDENMKIIQPFKYVDYFMDESGDKGLEIHLRVQHKKDAEPIQKGVVLDLTAFFPDTKGAVIENGDYLRIWRKLLPMNDHLPSSAHVRDKAFYEGVFDSEFYVRDGNFVNYKSTKFDYDDKFKIDPSVGQFPSVICIPSNNKIHF